MVYGPQQIVTTGVERIYLNRTRHRESTPTWNGDSIGHWEGDTLVVDTIGFNSKSWLQVGWNALGRDASDPALPAAAQRLYRNPHDN